jgi:exodeoxyribonuclease VII large subunit
MTYPLENSEFLENQEFTVTALSKSIQRTLEGKYTNIRLRGEISGLKVHTSGHVYLTLKDSESALDAVCWRGTVSKFPYPPEEGMDVICKGRITAYPARSKYQFIIESLQPAGVGALLKLLQERKEKLSREGLFDIARKRPLPYIPKVIGVVTSPTGAVIRDILHRLKERFPLKVLLWPVTVQGDTAVNEVVAAIQGFNSLPLTFPRPDVLIVARGGGSLEDLWAFNEEAIVRAVANSEIPIISAIGHETDTTLIDFAADRRAPTPTAAAEMAVPVLSDLLESLLTSHHRLVTSCKRMLIEKKVFLESYSRSLRSPQSLVEDKLQLLDDRTERLVLSLKTFLKHQTIIFVKFSQQIEDPRKLLVTFMHRFSLLNQRLQSLSFSRNYEYQLSTLQEWGMRLSSSMSWYLKESHQRTSQAAELLKCFSHEATLKRGFALIQDSEGRLLTQTTDFSPHQKVALRVQDGVISASILEK